MSHAILPPDRLRLNIKHAHPHPSAHTYYSPKAEPSSVKFMYVKWTVEDNATIIHGPAPAQVVNEHGTSTSALFLPI